MSIFRACMPLLSAVLVALCVTRVTDAVFYDGVGFGITLDTYMWYQEQPVTSRTARLSHYCTYAELSVPNPLWFDRITCGPVFVYEGEMNNQIKSVRVLNLAFRRIYSLKKEKGNVFIVYDGSSYVDVSGERAVETCSEWLKHGGVEDHHRFAEYYCKALLFKEPEGEAPVRMEHMKNMAEDHCVLTLEMAMNQAKNSTDQVDYEEDIGMSPKYQVRDYNAGNTVYSAAA